MNPITVIIKEGGKLHFTFAEKAIRIKAPEEWLKVHEDAFIDFTRIIEPYAYINFNHTLRGNIGTIPFDTNNLRLRLRRKEGHGKKLMWEKSLVIKNGYVKVIEADKWNHKNILYRYFYRLYKGEK